jgi:DNA invertase Pin-like site-specific DNA recombinase
MGETARRRRCGIRPFRRPNLAAPAIGLPYLRVSTRAQGQSGLGLDAQRKAVSDYLNGGRWSLIAEYVEVESGANDERPRLTEALARCRIHNATLVIAKLDRLSRDAHFLLGLQKAGVKFVATDMPEANEMIVGIMAVVAQAERKMISARTNAALQAAKERGKRLGGDRGNLRAVSAKGRLAALEARRKAIRQRAGDLAPIIAELKAQGITSLRGTANALNAGRSGGPRREMHRGPGRKAGA